MQYPIFTSLNQLIKAPHLFSDVLQKCPTSRSCETVILRLPLLINALLYPYRVDSIKQTYKQGHWLKIKYLIILGLFTWLCNYHRMKSYLKPLNIHTFTIIVLTICTYKYRSVVNKTNVCHDYMTEYKILITRWTFSVK